MTIHILGLGESLEEYSPDGNKTIGVNDIHSRLKTDFVVCIDHPKAFTPERVKSIKETSCSGFYSQVEDWNQVRNFKKIDLNRGRGIVKDLDSPGFCYSISSPYVAAVLAYKLGAKEIILHGVDFRTHENFKDHRRDKALRDFKELASAFKLRGVTLFVGSSWSSLERVLPIWKSKT